ncbi:hypothetical protein FEM48_ZijujUnG0065700 [Ziziphus jujuba var. spinosa]|uniref:QWRF motif-containing protein 2-like n=1 Tax=Ziziphus jujuba var. spinosa TaxID=714518 RepID=A0A978U8X0_ZIZJJ|nr:hypothetical protein FEM48_ZijujUnG0065700 [Ziziphus jujuba var. spinosa]
MVAAVSTTPFNNKIASQGRRPQNPTRPPLLPSEPDNALAATRRSKAREVTSRYMSSSSSSSSTSSSSSSTGSRRCPSPQVSKTPTPTATMTPRPAALPVTKRTQSAERRRPVTPRTNSLDLRGCNGVGGAGEMSAVQKLLFASTRSLSVSFQGESFAFQVSKVKRPPSPSPSPSPSVRKSTPERRKVTTPARGDQSENLKPMEQQQRWPGRLRQANCMNQSLDCTDERRSGSGSGGNVVRALQKYMAEDGDHIDGKLSSALGSAELEKAVVDSNSSVRSDVQSEPVAFSDSESVSSGSSTTTGAQEFAGGDGNGGLGLRGGPRGIIVPARFWQEAKNRLQRQPEPGSPLSRNGVKSLSTSGLVSSPRGVLNTRAQSSPMRSGVVRPASPNKSSAATFTISSPSRGISPSRVRNGVVAASSLNNAPSILSFAADLRRGKGGENRIHDAHILRILYNRLLQWRFVNARADASLSVQKLNAEAVSALVMNLIEHATSERVAVECMDILFFSVAKTDCFCQLLRSLYNAWITTSKLRESVRTKRTELDSLRQSLKLTAILKGQMIYLEEWSHMDRDYSSSLLGAIEALRASTLRLPVVGGARADVQNVKDAICTAVDVMQAMASSIYTLSSKAGEVNSVVAELANVTAVEQILLGQCKDLLSTVAALQKQKSAYFDLCIETSGSKIATRPESMNSVLDTNIVQSIPTRAATFLRNKFQLQGRVLDDKMVVVFIKMINYNRKSSSNIEC